MATSEAYSIIKALMEKSLLILRHQELVEWLDRLHSKGQLTGEEMQDLLQLAYQLEICEFPLSEQLVAAFN